MSVPQTETRGINEYFNEIYGETFNAVSRFVISKCGNVLDSEDILQNIYARFFSRIKKKGFNDIESPEAFLINIAKFECRNYFGVLKRRSKTSSFADYTEEQMACKKTRERLRRPISNQRRTPNWTRPV